MSGESAANTPLEQNPLYVAATMLCRQLSPYDLNPLNYNPLRDLLIELIDFEGLRKQNTFEVMICATNVRTARRRVFQSADLSVDAVPASATLPQMMTAVEIDGESYWDGGFTGNPATTNLLRRLPKCDLIVVRIDPVHRDAVPRKPVEIVERMSNPRRVHGQNTLAPLLYPARGRAGGGQLDTAGETSLAFHRTSCVRVISLPQLPHFTETSTPSRF
jgi:predicted acylesterase/phospholipase RssA